MKSLPLVFFPTTIAHIDDDKLFLKAISLTLSKNHKMLSFNHVDTAKETLLRSSSLLSKINITRKCNDCDGYDSAKHALVDINLQAILDLGTRAERLNDISVIIIDYDMPTVNGLKLAESFSALPAKKILLTGAADNSAVINAFNNRVIDFYISKNDPQLITKLDETINELTFAYFRDQFHSAQKHLETERPLPISDPTFIKFFLQWMQRKDIKEFYIINNNADYLAIDSQQQKHYFITHTDHTLDHFIDTYKESAELQPYLSQAKTREKIPYFGTNEPWQVDSNEWGKYFYGSNHLTGRENYYWIAVKE